MLNTNKQIKKVILVALLAIFTLPTVASADTSYGFDGGGYDSGWGSWGGGSSAYDYTPTYSYQPTYSDYYNAPSYGGGSYSTPSYGGSNYTSDYGSYYSTPSYTSSSAPVGNYNTNLNDNTNKNNNKNTLTNKNNIDVKNTNTNTSSSNSTSSSSATAINNNVNNVYVYANPTGNAVVYNPQHQYLNVYCVITPSNPRTGQMVTATAYASGGTGNYTYTWGGDVYSTSGPTTTFTSFTTGTKNITVTARSGQEIITKSCDVVFENENNNNNLSAVCYANPTSANINQTVTWSVTPNGGNGSYSYNWSGTDGLSGYGQYTTKQYGYSGTKSAYVTVTSGGKTVTANCSMVVYGNTTYGVSSVNITPNITSGTPVSGVYLSQLPATGLSLGFVEYMVAGMVLVLAGVVTFIYQARKRLMLENA